MVRISKIAVVLLCAVTMLAGAGLAFAQDAPPAKKPGKFLMGKPIEDFKIMGLDNKMKSFNNDIRSGKPVIINFMQTACSSCLTEMEYLAGIKETAGDKYTFATVSVDLQEQAAVKRYLKTYTQFADFDFYFDKDLAIAKRFGFSSTPAVALVASDGSLAYKMVGFGAEHRTLINTEIEKLK